MPTTLKSCGKGKFDIEKSLFVTAVTPPILAVLLPASLSDATAEGVVKIRLTADLRGVPTVTGVATADGGGRFRCDSGVCGSLVVSVATDSFTSKEAPTSLPSPALLDVSQIACSSRASIVFLLLPTEGGGADADLNPPGTGLVAIPHATARWRSH